MTTTELIKYIKGYQSGRKEIFTSDWEPVESFLLITEAELDQIEKVSVEMYAILLMAMSIIIRYGHDEMVEKYEQAIKNANNIKQI